MKEDDLEILIPLMEVPVVVMMMNRDEAVVVISLVVDCRYLFAAAALFVSFPWRYGASPVTVFAVLEEALVVLDVDVVPGRSDASP